MDFIKSFGGGRVGVQPSEALALVEVMAAFGSGPGAGDVLPRGMAYFYLELDDAEELKRQLELAIDRLKSGQISAADHPGPPAAGP